MRPRNPFALAVAILALGVAVLAAPAAGGIDAVACAVSHGNCFKKDLEGKQFEQGDLTHSDWFGATLVDASFRNSDLYRANFRNADLRHVDLSYGNRTDATFRGANLYRANLSRASYYGSSFRKAKLRYATIIGSNFDETDLTDADFTGAYLKGSSFARARLCRTIQPNGERRDDDCRGKGEGSGPYGGDCCFPGHSPPPKKDDGETENGGQGQDAGSARPEDEPIYGEL